MRFIKKVLKIAIFILIGIALVFMFLLQGVFTPYSDEKVYNTIENVTISHHQFEGYNYRKISTFKKLDTLKPTLVFVHGSPGSMLDFKTYFKDSALTAAANLIAYERIGYSIDNMGLIQPLKNEIDLLNTITDSLPIANTVVVGYSYGGPIALGSNKNYKKVVLFAPAVYSEVEPMFWFLNFYKWKATRWLMPKVLQGASKEKLQHREELRKFQENWHKNPSNIHVVHGDKDWIVPYGNSEYIQQQFPSDKFELIVLKDAGHDLIWSQYEEIKTELIKVIEE